MRINDKIRRDLMKDLDKIRQELDEIDLEIIKLIKKRIDLQPLVAEYKKANSLYISQPEREKELLNFRKKIANEFWISEELILKIFSDLIDEWKKIQENIIFWENSKESSLIYRLNSWNRIKKEISFNNSRNYYVNEREIWFIRLWENVWFEQSWKWEEFRRPVLVIKKIWNMFFCLPLTKWWKENRFYYRLESIDFWIDSKVILSQWRALDKKRFFQFLWVISEEEFSEIKKLLTNLY